MESIDVKVAFCTECKGYYAATPAKKEDSNHPEIIDHYFYHGEPRFTLNPQSFALSTQWSNTEIRTISLLNHQENDHHHCNCVKNGEDRKIVINTKDHKLVLSPENSEVDSDIYFTDLYYTYNNFHGVTTSSGRSASA